MNAPVSLATRVRLADLGDAGEVRRIEGFVRERGASLFHRPAWLLAVEAGTGQRACGLIAERMGAIAGWLPLTELRSAIFGRALVSSGFGVGGGICAEDDELAFSLAAAAERHADKGRFAGIELRGGWMPEGENWRRWNDRHCGFERPLAGDDEAELLAIPRKARAEVRKGIASELLVRTGRARADLRAHYAVYSESVRNLGTPVFPRKLFRAMLEVFPGESDILTVMRDGVPMASVLSFYHRGAVMPFWGGGTRAARTARASELMYFELMCHARRKGMEFFDFGRSKTESGPWKFKKNWGFTPEPLTYAGWSAPGAPVRDVDPTSPAYARRIALWKKLPLPFANLVGPPLARGLG